MQCAVCKTNVANFHLKNTKEATPRPAKTDAMDSLLPSAFDVNPFFVPPTNPVIPRSSTPVGFASPTARGKDSVVLRIDNVPWVRLSWVEPFSCSHKLQDITPPMIINWLKQPVARAHVLLDRKGKTLSHVFVEMANEDAAKVVLRTTQNSVLGQGKRARGVTVTRSSQEELMKAVSRLHFCNGTTSSLHLSCSHLGRANLMDRAPPWLVSPMKPSLQPCKLD